MAEINEKVMEVMKLVARHHKEVRELRSKLDLTTAQFEEYRIIALENLIENSQQFKVG